MILDPQLSRPEQEDVDRALLENMPPTVGQMLRDRVAATPDTVAYQYPDANDEWQPLTWAETDAVARRWAAGLVDLGVQLEDRVAIASSTRYEWALADLAVMCSGGATTTIYPTTIATDVAYILQHSGSVVAFVEDASQVAKIDEVRAEVPELRTVVVMDATGVELREDVIDLEELARRGDALLAREPGVVDARIDATGPETLATIIYTSGTTGRPKGVRLMHRVWSYQGVGAVSYGGTRPDDVHFLWLPLSHVFGKSLLSIALYAGIPTYIDGRVDRIVENLASVRPTFMAAAPRIFEKVHAGVRLQMEQAGGAKLRIFEWANKVGHKVARAENEGRPVPRILAAQYALADKLVYAKVRERFGGRLRVLISGSAALNQEIAEWFHAAGMPILEGYGLTESSSGATVNRRHGYRLGSVGWPIPGTEVRIAEDGEVLLRGPGIMSGYHNNAEATAEVLGDDGWFHTGDIGELDANGFLRITDRKKDLFKTSNGKYVAPSMIESRFKGICPYVSQLIVHGADRPFVTALVTLDPQAIMPWAAENGLGGRSYEEVAASPQARAMVQEHIDELNADLNRWEQVKRFDILERDLSVEEGDLTPSLKLRRRVVVDKYADRIEELYRS